MTTNPDHERDFRAEEISDPERELQVPLRFDWHPPCQSPFVLTKVERPTVERLAAWCAVALLLVCAFAAGAVIALLLVL